MSDEARNYYGEEIVPAERFEGAHVCAFVPASGGLPPVCSCGWTRRDGLELADHLLEMAP